MESDFYDRDGNYDPVWKKGKVLCCTISNIDWVVDDDETPNLPTKIKVDINIAEEDCNFTNETAENYIEDFLSDEYDYCHNGFSLTIDCEDYYEYRADEDDFGILWHEDFNM